MAAFDHAQSPRLGQPTPVENPGVQLVTQTTLPEVARRGQIVYLLDLDQFRVHDGVAWQNPAAGSSIAGTQTFVGPTQPVADAVGDLWMNTTTYQLYAWDGTAWKPAVDPVAQQAANAASTAQAKAEQALGLAAGKTTIWYLDVQPALPAQQVVVGDYWINTVTNKLYKFDSLSTVIEVQDADIANALNSAGTAQATADQKIETYTVLWADRPLDLGAMGVGDILFAVDQGNATFRWDGSDWVALGSSTVPSVTVTDGLSLQSGAVAHIEAQSSMVLDGNVTAPSTPPTYSQVYPTQSFTIPSYFTPTTFTTVETKVSGICFDATYMYVAINQYNSGRSLALGAVYRYLRSNNSYVDKHNYSYGEKWEIIDISTDNSSLHMALHACNNDNISLQRVVKSTMATDSVSKLETATITGWVGLCADNTNVWALGIRTADGTLRLTKYDNAYNFIDNVYTPKAVTGTWRGLEVGTFPGTGGVRAVVNATFDSSVPSFQPCVITSSTSSLTPQTAEEWETSPNLGGGMAYDGANFYQVPRVITSVGGTDFFLRYKYSNDTSTTTRWVSSDYRAVNSGTGANMYRTPQGPKTKITPIKRATLQITAPPIPPDPNPGVEGDVNAVGIYIGLSATEPAVTGMWLQTPERAIGSRTLTVGDLGPIVTGTHPLTAGTFPAGVPGLVSSGSLRFDSTPKNYIDGTGGARLDGLLPPGSMTAYAGTVAPSGWRKCDGGALSTSAFPDLFAVVNYTFGGSGTVFNVPNLTPGTGMMWLIKL